METKTYRRPNDKGETTVEEARDRDDAFVITKGVPANDAEWEHLRQHAEEALGSGPVMILQAKCPRDRWVYLFLLKALVVDGVKEPKCGLKVDRLPCPDCQMKLNTQKVGS